jgi:hypothetical protein
LLVYIHILLPLCWYKLYVTNHREQSFWGLGPVIKNVLNYGILPGRNGSTSVTGKRPLDSCIKQISRPRVWDSVLETEHYGILKCNSEQDPIRTVYRQMHKMNRATYCYTADVDNTDTALSLNGSERQFPARID